MSDDFRPDVTDTAERYIREGTGTYRERRKLMMYLMMTERHSTDPDVVQRCRSVIPRLRQDTENRSQAAARGEVYSSLRSGRLAFEAPDVYVRLSPGVRPFDPRHSFETLVRQITDCRIGDGTLEIDDCRRYKNEHIRYLWERYRAAATKLIQDPK